jgi:hypothetical protein
MTNSKYYSESDDRDIQNSDAETKDVYLDVFGTGATPGNNSDDTAAQLLADIEDELANGDMK